MQQQQEIQILEQQQCSTSRRPNMRGDRGRAFNATARGGTAGANDWVNESAVAWTDGANTWTSV